MVDSFFPGKDVISTATPERAADEAGMNAPASIGQAFKATVGQDTSDLIGFARRHWHDDITADTRTPERMLKADEANKIHDMPEEHKFTHDVSESSAQDIADSVKKRMAAENVFRRFAESHNWLTRNATGMVASMLDPVNAAALLVPGIGEERVAYALTQAGLGAKTSIVAGKMAAGATGAMAGTAAGMPLKYMTDHDMNYDFTVRDAMTELFYSAPFGAIMHAGVSPAIGAGTRWALGAEQHPYFHDYYARPQLAAGVEPLSVGAQDLRLAVTRGVAEGSYDPSRAPNIGDPSIGHLRDLANMNQFDRHAQMSATIAQIMSGREVDNTTLIPDHSEQARKIAPELHEEYDRLKAERDALATEHVWGDNPADVFDKALAKLDEEYRRHMDAGDTDSAWEAVEKRHNLVKDFYDSDDWKAYKIEQELREYVRDILPVSWDLRVAAGEIPGVGEGGMASFGGEFAKRPPSEHLQMARDMEAKGASREDIWDKTGWRHDVEGRWKFEIDDSKSHLDEARFTPHSLYPNTTRFSGKLGDVFQHEELFKQYPQLRDVQVHLSVDKDMESEEHSYGSAGNNTITVTSKNYAHIRQILLHEIQHIIQGHEFFAEGGNPELASGFKEFDDILDRVLKERGIPKDAYKYMHPMHEEYKKAKDEAMFHAYRRISGETESRNVEERRDLTPEERKQYYPWLTQDIIDEGRIPSGMLHPDDVKDVLALRSKAKEAEDAAYKLSAGKYRYELPDEVQDEYSRLMDTYNEAKAEIQSILEGAPVPSIYLAYGSGIMGSKKMFSATRTAVIGMTDPAKRTAWISAMAVDPKLVAREESGHAIRASGLFKPDEWSVLRDAAINRGWIDGMPKEVRDRYEEAYAGRGADGVRDAMVEEAIMHRFAKGPEAWGEPGGPVARLMARIQELLERVGNWMSQRGFRSANDVFRAMESGEIASRDTMQPHAARRMGEIDNRMKELEPQLYDAYDQAKTSYHLDIPTVAEAQRSLWRGGFAAAMDKNVLQQTLQHLYGPKEEVKFTPAKPGEVPVELQILEQQHQKMIAEGYRPLQDEVAELAQTDQAVRQSLMTEAGYAQAGECLMTAGI
jgi:hypothetical protein